MTTLPRVWVTGMWGFEPEKAGYVGFTNEGARKKYIHECAPGDLMMIIGQRGEYSIERDVGRVLGLVELDPVPIQDTDRMAPETHEQKIARGWRDRWTYAMPILRAWKTTREVKAKYVAPITCKAANARAIGATALLLQPDEVERLMAFPIKKAAIYGVAEWISEGEALAEEPARVAVSRGPAPSFGTVVRTTVDGETQLYLMQLDGDLSSIFPKIDHRNNAVLKVGRSNDVLRRCEEMNSGFPPGLQLKWRVRNRQAFSSAVDAHDAEQKLLSRLEDQRLAIGREFAVVPLKRIDGLLAAVSEKSAFLIRA